MEINFRDYQSNDMNQIRESYRRGNRAVIYVCPTGGGKTFSFCNMAKLAQEKGNDSLILVHREELIDQSSETLTDLGIDRGVIWAKVKMDPDEGIQVASVSTLVRRLGTLPWLQPRFIIIDEAHHAVAGTWRKILDAFPDSFVLGVTATPIRLDGKGLGIQSGGIFQDMVKGPTTRELIDQGWLCDYDIFAPPIGVDLQDVKRKGGDFARDQLSAALDKPSITGSAVGHYKRLCPGKPAIAFCVSVLHADHVAEQFRAEGFRSIAINGKTKKDIRKEAIKDLAGGRLDVLCSCDIISEGTDIPVAEVAILLRPTESLALYLQQCGRVLRPVPGKRALILDHVNNVMRHGFLDEDRDWSLDGIKKKTRGEIAQLQIEIRQCTECDKVHKTSPTCPHCGHVYPIKKKQDLRKIKGSLDKLTEDDRAAIIEMRKQDRNNQQNAQTLQDLIKEGHRRGMKNPAGWAGHVWKDRQRKKQQQRSY